MGKFVMKDAGVKINSVDLSDHASSVTLETTTDDVDVTSFTAGSYRELLQGFKDVTCTVTFFQDYASGKVDATLWPLYSGGSVFTVAIKPEGTGTVVWNLNTAQLFSYSPASGAVGDASSFDASFRNSGTAGLTRGTTF